MEKDQQHPQDPAQPPPQPPPPSSSAPPVDSTGDAKSSMKNDKTISEAEAGGDHHASSAVPEGGGNDGGDGDGNIHDDEDDECDAQVVRDEKDKGHSFRKRRLTYAKHGSDMAFADSVAAAAAAAAALTDDDEEEEEEEAKDDGAAAAKESTVVKESPPPPGAPTEEKAKADVDRQKAGQEAQSEEGVGLPTSAKAPDDANGADSATTAAIATASPSPPPAKRQRRESSPSSDVRSMKHMHMTQGFICRIRNRLLRTAPASGSIQPPPHHVVHRRKSSMTEEEEDAAVFRHDHLPFSRDVVGTFSCHGIEPLYDEEEGVEYSDEEEEEGADNGEGDDVEHKENAGDGGGGGTGGGDEPCVIAKTNQDRGGVAYPYANDAHTALFAAYDGHGEGGEHVAQFAMTEIQRRLEKHPDFETNVERAFVQTFVGVDEDLEDQGEIEPLYSGTTACVVLMQGSHLSIANAGDSRAVMARRVPAASSGGDGNGDDGDEDCRPVRRTAIDLSTDQNPDTPGEQERIERCGGFVSPPPEEGLSARVWLDPDYTHIGLAMARSIGDHAVKSVGVISEPVVTTHEISDEDEFMILATDGVWEFIDSTEAVDIVARHFDGGRGASAACQDLIETAAVRWKVHEGGYRDDITAVVVKVKELWEDGRKG